MFRSQKRSVSIMYLCTFKNIALFTSGDRFESPYKKSLREGFRYGECNHQFSTLYFIISAMEKEVLRILNTATTA